MSKIQGLLKWCQIQLDEYPNISIQNFTTSWRNGLAFNALIHKFKPDLINYHGLDPTQIYYNNFKAFKTAEVHFGIPALLDPKDMEICECPEQLSIITYVSQFYNCLKEMKPEGGYKSNKFKNTNNGNSDFEDMSRASITRLSKLTCTICLEKVFLLERYVADDKLYHRKCYRGHQIKNIDSESEVIGDYLNIYGEINPNLNTNIYVHPIQNFNQIEDVLEIQTSSPVNLLEEVESEEDDDLEDYISESLSSYDDSESHSHYNSDEDKVIEKDCNQYQSTTHDNSDNDNVIRFDEKSKSEIDGYPLNTEINDTIQMEIDENVETDTDKNVNVQILGEEECAKKLNLKNDIYSTNDNKIEELSEDSNTMVQVDNYNLLVSENTKTNNGDLENNNYLKDNNTIFFNVEDEIDVKSIKDIKEIKDDLNFKKQDILREVENQLSEITSKKLNEPKLISKEESRKNISPIQPFSQENLIVNIDKIEIVKPVKQRLYIKKRDKKLPYCTFFEVPHDECVNRLSPNLRRDSDELETSLQVKTDLSKTVSTYDNENKASSEINEEISHKKKLIKIHDTVDYEGESDVSSIEDEEYDCVQPQITRNSIWRKPIISSTVTKKHQSACVPIEGKFRDYAEFKDRLEQLNSKQSEIEIKAREIQEKLWEENSSTPLYESLLAKWLDLVEEKDKIFYEENALYSWIKDLKLQEMKLKLEAQIRLLSTSGSGDLNKNQKEKELVNKLIETVNKRAELVDDMHKENMLRIEIKKNRQEALELSSASHDITKNKQSKQEKYNRNSKAFWNRKTSH